MSICNAGCGVAELKNQRTRIKYFILTNLKDKDLRPRYLHVNDDSCNSCNADNDDDNDDNNADDADDSAICNDDEILRRIFHFISCLC